MSHSYSFTDAEWIWYCFNCVILEICIHYLTKNNDYLKIFLALGVYLLNFFSRSPSHSSYLCRCSVGTLDWAISGAIKAHYASAKGSMELGLFKLQTFLITFDWWLCVWCCYDLLTIEIKAIAVSLVPHLDRVFKMTT